MKHTKSIAKARDDFKNLEQTLQEAGKLPPSKPDPFPFEKMLIKENDQNPYQQALLSMQMAASKTSSTE